MTFALAIDTTSDYLSLALARDGAPVAHHYAREGTAMNRTILAVLDRLLTQARARPADVEVVIAARGPGSFTGTRIGLAVAKTFALVHGTAVVGVDTLRLIAAQAQAEEGLAFHAALNCARDEVFHAPFRWEGGRPRAKGPIALTNFTTFAGQVGGAPVVLRRFEPVRAGFESVSAGLRLLPLAHPHPDGRLLLREGLADWEGAGGAPLPPVAPLYLKHEAIGRRAGAP